MDSATKAGVSYRFDDVVVDCDRLRIEKDGQPRKLTPRAFDVLVYLVEHCGRVVEKQELFDNVWKEQFVTDNALTRIIKEIRQVIGDDADAPRYIETVPKHGYRFIAQVENIEARGVKGAETIASGEPVAAPSRSPGTPTQGEPASRSKIGNAKAAIPRKMKLLGAIIIIAVGVAATLIIWKTRSAPTQTTGVAETTQITTWPGLDIFPTLSPDGNSIAYSSDHNGSFEVYTKQLTAGAREIQVTSDGQQNLEPAWSPDGRLIAYYSKNRSGIWVVPASGGLTRQLTEFGARPAWSPDGSSIAFQSAPAPDLGANARNAMPPSTLWIVAAQGGDPKPITQVGNPPGGHGSPSWSPDGKRIVFSASDFASYSIWMISVKGDELNRVTMGTDPVYSPNGEWVYFGLNYELWKVSVSPDNGEPLGEPVKVAGAGAASIRYMTISADETKMAYSVLASASNLWSVPISLNSGETAGAPEPLAQNTSFRNLLPAFSPDGQKLAFCSWRTTSLRDIWIMDSDGKNPVQLTTDRSGVCPSWFPEGDRIAFLSVRALSDRDKGLGPGKLWSIAVESGREKLLLDFGEDVEYARMSPDGKVVAFNSRKSGTINVWTVAVEGGQPVQLTFDNEQMGWPCWSPDGKLLAFQIKRGDDTHIMVMPGSGGTSTQLTFDRGQSWVHSWSPNGDKIAFAGFRDGYWNVWWVSRTSKTQKQITNYTKLNAFVRYPAWSPLGNQIAYEYAETTGNIWLLELR